MIKLSWNWLAKEFFNNTSGIYPNYKQHEKSCLRSHKTAKILSHPYKKLARQETSQWLLWSLIDFDNVFWGFYLRLCSCRIEHISYKLNNKKQKKQWRNTTIIIKFNVIIFFRLGRWNFSLLNCNKIFQVLDWVVFQSLPNLAAFSAPRNNTPIRLTQCGTQFKFFGKKNVLFQVFPRHLNMNATLSCKYITPRTLTLSYLNCVQHWVCRIGLLGLGDFNSPFLEMSSGVTVILLGILSSGFIEQFISL